MRFMLVSDYLLKKNEIQSDLIHGAFGLIIRLVCVGRSQPLVHWKVHTMSKTAICSAFQSKISLTATRPVTMARTLDAMEA